MSDSKHVLKFPIDDSEQLIEVVEGLTEVKVDMDVDSTPSSIKITLYGSEDRVQTAISKVNKLIEKIKTS